MSEKPTAEQQTLIDVVKTKELKKIAIKAGPGCGKSSTLVMLSKYISDKGQMTCFGADIRKELNEKLKDSNFDAKTFNSIGWSTIRRELKRRLGRQPSFEEMKTDEAKYRKIADKAMEGDYFNDYGISALLVPDGYRYEAVKFIDELVSKTMVTMTDNTDVKALVQLIELYGFRPNIDMEDEVKAQAIEDEIKNFGLDHLSALMSIGEKVIESELWMTFTDQVYYTVKWNLRPWQTKYLFIDEAQDISEMELRLLSKCVRSGGYVVIVGDPDQSIMSFKGAMPGSFNRVVKYFGAEVFPLSATFRCPRRVVRLANMVKPTLQAFFDKEGIIERKTPDSLVDIIQKRTDADGELAVIARTTAPLIRMCLDLIGADIAATVLGRDIGKQLNRLLDKIADTSDYTFDNLLTTITKYKLQQVERMTKKMTDEKEIEAFGDTVDALRVIVERHTDPNHFQPATSLDDLKSRITDLFTEVKDTNRNIIKLMTAHKSKGMEFDTVILYDDFRIGKVANENRVSANPIDETYVWFVAVTRTKNRLVVLSKDLPDWLFGHLPGHPGYELPSFTPPTEQPIEADDMDEEPEAEEPVAEEEPPQEPERALTKQGENAKQWAIDLLDEGNFVILDTETTHLKGEIVSLAVIDHAGNALINTLIKPARHKMSSKASEINGITDDMLEDAPTFREVFQTLAEVVQDKTIVCYNVKFDRDMVNASSNTNGVPYLVHQKDWHCAMLRYVSYNPEKVGQWGKGAWWKLQEALEQENVDTTGVDFHDALADVRATLALIQAMADQPITAFDGKNDPLPFKDIEPDAFKRGEAVYIKPIRMNGIIHAYDHIKDKYSVHITDGHRKGKFHSYDADQLQSRFDYDALIGPDPAPITMGKLVKVNIDEYTQKSLLDRLKAVQEKHPGYIVFIRMGDFYECFKDDAELVADELDTMLTTRKSKSEGELPMTGVPAYDIDKYTIQLLEAGHNIALCNRVEQPEDVKADELLDTEKEKPKWKFQVGDRIQCASDGKTGIVKEISK